MHKFLFYYKFIICLSMFRTLCALHQEVKIVLYNIWYHHTCRWPSGAQVERGLQSSLNLCTQRNVSMIWNVTQKKSQYARFHTVTEGWQYRSFLSL